MAWFLLSQLLKSSEDYIFCRNLSCGSAIRNRNLFTAFFLRETYLESPSAKTFSISLWEGFLEKWSTFLLKALWGSLFASVGCGQGNSNLGIFGSYIQLWNPIQQQSCRTGSGANWVPCWRGCCWLSSGAGAIPGFSHIPWKHVSGLVYCQCYANPLWRKSGEKIRKTSPLLWV